MSQTEQEFDQFFELIAKVSSTSKSIDPLLDQSLGLLNEIKQDVGGCINEVVAQHRTALTQALNSATAEAQLQISLPMLVNRSNVLVFSDRPVNNAWLCADVFRNTEQNHQLNSLVQALSSVKVPVVFYHAPHQSNATIYNLTDNTIELSLDQLEAFFKLGTKEAQAAHFASAAQTDQTGQTNIPLVAPQDLAKLCLIPADFNDHCCQLNLIFISHQTDFSDKIFQNISSLANAALAMLSQPLLLPPLDLPIEVAVLPFNLRPQQTNVYKRALTKSEIVHLSSQDTSDLHNWLQKKSQSGRNFSLMTQVRCLMYHVSCFTNQSIQELKQHIEGINKFRVAAPQEFDFIGELLNGRKDKIDLLSQNAKKFETLISQVPNKINELQDLFAQRGFDLQDDKSLGCISRIKALQQLGYLAWRNHDAVFLSKIVNKQKAIHDPQAALNSLYLKHAQHQPLSAQNFDFTKIEHVHAALQLLSDQQMSLPYKSRLASQIPEAERTAYEHYLVGYLYNEQGNVIKELACLRRAFDMGEIAAAVELIKYTPAHVSSQELQVLADTLQPDAAFAYYQYLEQQGQSDLAQHYLIIAASQGHAEALDTYAKAIYSKLKVCKELRSEDLKRQAAQALEIFKQQTGKKGKRAAKIGRLMCLLDQKSQAIPFLKKAAKHKDVFACVTLGSIFLYGQAGMAQDLEQAKDYLEMVDTPESRALLSEVEDEIREQESNNDYDEDDDYSSYSYSSSDDDDDDEITLWDVFRSLFD